MASRSLKLILLGIAVVGAVAAMAAAVMVVFVFSALGTQVVRVRIEGTVHDRETGRPVPGCLLSFVQGHIGISPAEDDHRSDTPTDAAGHGVYTTPYSHGGSIFWPFGDRDPRMRIYIGAPPRFGTFDDVETWEVTLRFRESWRSVTEVEPRVEVRRFMGHDENMNPPEGRHWRSAGFDPLPTGPNDAKVEARVHVGKDGDRPSYRIPLGIYLNPAQIAACQGRAADSR